MTSPSKTRSSGTAFEVLTIGRVGVDIYPLEIGVRLNEVSTFGKYLGGSPTNVAVAAARHGRRSAVITRTGEDPFGTFVHEALRSFGVDDRFVTAVPGLPTPVTFCEILPPDDFPIYFYRFPKAPDLEIRTEELDMDAVESAGVFWFSLTGLSEEPSRSAHFAALKRRSRRRFTIFDLDYRAQFWKSQSEAAAAAAEALRYCDVAVGNLDEMAVALGKADPADTAGKLIDMGLTLAVVKQGHLGVLGASSDELVKVEPLNINVVNGLGAGDGFGGALCHGLLSGWPLRRVLEFANGAGAIVAGEIACSSAMPTPSRIEEVLADFGRI